MAAQKTYSALAIAALVVLGCFPGVASSAGDPARGARAFAQCMACHSVEPGLNLTGPSLAHVWGRKAGTTEGFLRYSSALQRSGLVWDAKTLDRWLTDPQRTVPGTSMTFPGIKDTGMRADLIAFLQAVSEGKAPAGSGRGMGGGMMGTAEPADLRRAPAEALVASLHRCHDTYILRTGAGATHKIWEYNLRLKTDSGPRGPLPGKPVVLGSGMRGDRVSVVFTSPAEIGQFVKESCD